MYIQPMWNIFFLSIFLLVSSTFAIAKDKYTGAAVGIQLNTEEADAVLFILNKKKNNQAITNEDWQRLFSSEGYIRLKKRETSLRREFNDQDFKGFVLSDKLYEREKILAETLAKWKQADTSRAALKALAYLPKGAHINAKIYPVIKPRDNSFVFETDTDPAIFLYLDPMQSKEKFENTLAHELHHIGYASSCPNKKAEEAVNKLPENKRRLHTWIGAFGEGFAMLAAAGGTDVHPHAVSDENERTRWDKDVANFNNDLKKVERFFLDILEKHFESQNEINTVGFSFFGVQGAWYTVGWKMSVLIEKTFGRKKLIECICDTRKFLATYNKAVKKQNRSYNEPPALWSETIIKAFE